MLKLSKLLCLLLAANWSLNCLAAFALAPVKSYSNYRSRPVSARSAYLRQLVNPETKQNLGVAYFIELNRAGHLYKTNNKSKFRSGDQIRFHVFANDDAYVYIVMRQGSKGTKSILFPLAATGKNNFVKRGRDCIVPTESALQFDETPGVENVGLLLSREKIDPKLLLNYPSRLTAYVPGYLSKTNSRLSAKRTLPSRTKMSIEKSASGSLLKHQQGDKPFSDLVSNSSSRGRRLWRSASVVLRESNVVIVVKEGAGAVAVDFSLIHEP
jgi:hypothetical protein